MDSYRTKSTSRFSAKLTDYIILEENSQTRKVLAVTLNDAKRNKEETVGITIIHQRKNANVEWEDVNSIQLNTLKGGEGVKLILDSTTTRKLFDELTKLYTLVKEKGVVNGEMEYAIMGVLDLLDVPSKRKTIISNLLSGNHGEEVWHELSNSNPDLATKLSLAKIQADRKKALNQFSENINNNNEAFWQRFFEDNSWIFGYGLNYKFLNILDSQPYYGSTNFTGKGGQRGDFLVNSEGASKFTVLVEIKTPVTKLLTYNNGIARKERNGAYLLSSHLLGAITQLQVNTRTWTIDSQDKKNAKPLEQRNIYTVEPKGILVIGNSSELQENEAMLNSFEIFRRNINNPEIITFDELYERASFIVYNDATKKQNLTEY